MGKGIPLFPYSRFWRVVTCVRNPAPGTCQLCRRLSEYISRLLEAGYGRYGLCVADGVYVSKRLVSPLPWVCRCSFSRVSPSALTTPGMDDFSLAKVECHGMTASTDFQVYLPMTVCDSLPVLLHKSGYSTNSHGKFLALHALCQALSSQWQRKSLSRRDTGIKKAQHRGTGQKK